MGTVPFLAMAEDEPRPDPTTAQQNLQALSAGTRRLTDENIAEGDLISELLRRTEDNKDRNAAIIKRVTESNAFTAIDGSVSKRLVTDLTGRNVYLNAEEIRALTRERRLACAPSVMEACRMVEPGKGLEPLQLPALQKMACDDRGRNCKFNN